MQRGVWLFVGVLVLLTPLGWTLTDHLEARNDFCGSCHLDSTTPLHERKLESFFVASERSLAGAHRGSDAAFRCIDCHGGTGVLGRVRMKAVAARDAALYLLGQFGEPEAMDHPLWDADCARCHASYTPARDDAFHAFAAHNAEFPTRCVECHTAHTEDGEPDQNFLSRGVVLPFCRNCHEEL